MQHYDIANDRWRIESELMDVPMADAAICTDAAGQIHVINGTDGVSLWSQHQVYDSNAPAGSRWSTATAPSVGGDLYVSQGSGCVVINHILYLFGGYGVIGVGSPAPLANTWAWNAQTDVWSDTGFSMNTARFWFGYGSKSNNGYVAGGTNDDVLNTPMASTERFIPSSGWQTLMSLPQALLAPGLVGTESGVLVFGGANSSFVAQTATYLCTGSCPPNFSWNNTNVNLNTGRVFAGYAGGPPNGPYVGGGRPPVGTGSFKTSERFQS
jgi:N-acetylneuraminic acid mutarotase